MCHHPPPPTSPVLSHCARRCSVSSSSAPAGLPGPCLTFSCCGTGFSGSTPARCLPWAPPLSNHITLWTVPMASCCFLGTCHGREWIIGVMRENQALKTQDPYLILFVNGKIELHVACWDTDTLVMSSSHTPLAHCLLTSSITWHQFSLWAHYNTTLAMLQIKLPEPLHELRFQAQLKDCIIFTLLLQFYG